MRQFGVRRDVHRSDGSAEGACRPKQPPPLPPRQTGGVIPRAIRGGNPLQMLNPRAPARYGTAQQSVALETRRVGKMEGIKLFEFTF